jgi:hypothetical protein
MATKGSAGKRGEAQPARWRGDEVEDVPGTEAEQGAERAEGNTMVRADEESERLHASDLGEPVDAVGSSVRRKPSDDEEIEDLAAERRARREAGVPPIRGKL